MNFPIKWRIRGGMQFIRAMWKHPQSATTWRWVLGLISINAGVAIAAWTFPSLSSFLWLSADRPWGIITAVFLHTDPLHLLNNILGFCAWSVIFIVLNIPVSGRVYRFNSWIFPRTLLLSAFMTNLVDYVVHWYPRGATSTGALGFSGAVFASAGVCSALSLALLCASIREFRKPGPSKAKVARLCFYALAIVLVAYAIHDPAKFLIAEPGVNVFAHAAGFFIGMMSSLILFFAYLGHIILKRESIF